MIFGGFFQPKLFYDSMKIVTKLPQAQANKGITLLQTYKAFGTHMTLSAPPSTSPLGAGSFPLLGVKSE